MEEEHREKLNTITTSLAVIDQKLDGVNEHLAKLNGKTSKNSNNIEELKISQVEIQTATNTTKKIGTLAFGVIVTLIGIITSISVYAYEQDRQNLKKNVEKVASDLLTYQGDTSTDTGKIILLLQDLVKKK